MLQSDIARLMAQIPKEEQLEKAAAIAQAAANGDIDKPHHPSSGFHGTIHEIIDIS